LHSREFYELFIHSSMDRKIFQKHSAYFIFNIA
jgi:hypothetical protein